MNQYGILFTGIVGAVIAAIWYQTQKRNLKLNYPVSVKRSDWILEEIGKTKITSPADMVIDDQGNLYVVDKNRDKNMVFKIQSKTNEVTVIAGCGKKGFRDGDALQATFNEPNGIAVDSINNIIYIADTMNHKIRKIHNGVVSTLAGSGVQGFQDGVSAEARFWYPFGIALSNNGYLYVADTRNQRIRKIDTVTGFVETVAGDGEAGSWDGNVPNVQFSTPIKIAIDGSDNLYICERIQKRIRKISMNGTVSTHEIEDCMALGMVVDRRGRIFVCDEMKNRVVLIRSFGNPAFDVIIANPLLTSAYNFNGAQQPPQYRNQEEFSESTLFKDDLWRPCGITVDSRGNIRVCTLAGAFFGLRYKALRWECERQLWIGLVLNGPESCNLAKLPKDLIKEIIRFANSYY